MRLEIPGNPLAQARMRLYTRNNRNLCFDPQARDKVLIKRQVANQVKQYEAETQTEYQFPLCPRVSFVFYMPIPKFMPKSRKKYAEQGLLKHTSKPDVDNLIKLYMDCINELAITDDSKASIGFAIKLYHAQPRTLIFIEETDELLDSNALISLKMFGTVC